MKYDIDDSPFETWHDEIHAPVEHRYKKPSKTEFLGSPAWRKLRSKVLQYWGTQCMRCKCLPEYPNVDHIKPRAYYPELALDFSNLQVLCWPCNKKKGTNVKDYRPHTP